MSEQTKALAVASPPDSMAVFQSEASFVSAQRMAKALASSSLVPDAYRGEAGVSNCLIALELSSRIGASVIAVMQSMVPIHGKPAWSSAFLIATVNTCGRFSAMKFRFEGTENTDSYGCRAISTERTTGEELVGTLITIGMAKAEGWFTKAGSKWKTMPEQMLRYRAAAFWTRAFAPELSLGMHTQEEEVDMVNVTPKPAAKSAFAPKSVVEQAPAPEPSPAPAEVIVDAVEVEVVPTPEQHPLQAALQAEWGDEVFTFETLKVYTDHHYADAKYARFEDIPTELAAKFAKAAKRVVEGIRKLMEGGAK